MENIINTLYTYIKNHPRRYMSYIKKNLITNNVYNILIKYDLNLNELCYRLRNDIPLDKVFKCKYCGKKIMYTNKHKYSTYCSLKCAAKYIQNLLSTKIKHKQTCLRNWGETTNLKSIDTKNKIKQTCLKKFGKEYYVQTDDFKKKSKEKCIQKYGVSSYTKTSECKEKTKRTNLLHYGETTFLKTKKCKDFMRQDSLKKNGTEYYSQSKIFQQKVYNTKTKNKTHTKSKEEDEVYNLLLTKFNKDDIIRHYKSKLYPFQCDFYIKSLDLYIEYNGYWTHGLEPFNKDNSEHCKILKLWEQRIKEKNFKGKNKKSYIDAIYVWTILDPLKIKTAKENKLNYKVFWNIEEVKNWIKGI